MPLRRSALYVPGDNVRALAKARGLPADVLILDLEDAVAPEHKTAARQNVRDALREGFPAHEVVVRMNALTTPWGDDDLQMLLSAAPHAIMLPKADDPAALRQVSLGIPLWLTVETPRGVLRLEELAATPGVEALVLGTTDLVRDVRARHTPNRENLWFALSKAVTCARAYGLTVLDGVFLDLRDTDGLRAACRQARDFGFDGKTLIHPAQVGPANEAFAPTPAEVAHARALLDVWEAARAEGRSVAVLDGRLVEHLHATEARELLRVAEDVARRG